MKIRFFKLQDYEQLVALYKTSPEFDFDEVTDSREGIERKAQRDPQSILIAEDKDQIVGSVSIIEDGRIAWLFRLIGNNSETTRALTEKAEGIIKDKGYKNLHNFTPNDPKFIEQRKHLEFLPGKTYKWLWKEL